ncbi:hypothetical protein [Cellvibrio japonicus]|uniref:hypothetical protein n=1 Tax=Cellvibrio japonicus TaxID=155077 RepID=UPI0005A27654|nr:hypothetical protein [Cellvibrio japonicus]QEI11482.1 hypothetical protein FY117_04045 [Cellvibrio japonicus]QEI15056.1 hypothetical protein FY116_04045 [Cellvibrio japonicus]QEI18636.1 hypothetical protein FY115_04045 [Cellvibrio japonicus]
MPKIFKDISLYGKRPLAGNDSKIEYMSRVICALFIKGMPKIKTDDFWKLSINFNHGDQSEKNRVVIGLYEFYCNFPVDEFLLWETEKQQEFMLNFVSNTVHQAFSAQGIDTSFIEAACEYVRINNFINIFEGKGQKSPHENIKARIFCEQEMLEARIYMEIGKGKKWERYLIDRINPSEFQIQIYFGRIDWISQNNLVLNMIGGRKIEVIREH